uniref:Uncharacterized protein n=1 Tax=Chaetoceros debilis TaxID=122233 RepID=A0A7S3VG87_9STRA|mmetsp:Transcript_22118/g.33637  ORF Transcript_22118/g.33637 Transcript_22118/m.33637 type:complete len:150 (+) Transcript_22118:96-545(+)
MIGRFALNKGGINGIRKMWNSGGSSVRLSSGGITRMGLDHPSMAQIVKYNGVVTISGQVDVDAKDIVGQTKNVLKQVDSLLEQAGTDKSKLLTANIWLKNAEKDFATVNSMWNEWIDEGNKPARATVEANMVSPDWLIEVQVSAAADNE